MSKKVGIVGAAVTPFKAKWNEKTYYELAQMAVREAVKDAARVSNLPDDGESAVSGGTMMDDDRQIVIEGQLKLTGEEILLLL